MDSNWVISVGEKDFQPKVIEKSKSVPVIVDFWATWCGPCRQLTPLLETLVNERKGEVLLAKVNIDEEQQLAMQFRIEAVPTVIGFRGGRAVLDFAGLLPEPDLRRFIDAMVPTAAEREAAEARRLETTDPARAEKLYRDALAQERSHEAAILGLARICLADNRIAEAEELLENLGASSENADEAERLSAQLYLKKQAQGLPSEESLRAKVAAEPKNAQARYELGLLLAVTNRYADALEMFMSAGEADGKLAAGKVREAMVKIFHLIGNDTFLANDYRNRLSLMLY